VNVLQPTRPPTIVAGHGKNRLKVPERIAAAVRRNGECDANWLFFAIYRGPTKPNRSVLKAHIWSLRQLGYPIHAVQTQQRVWAYKWGIKERFVKMKCRPVRNNWLHQSRDSLGRWQ